MLVTIQNMMLLFSPCKRCLCPCSDAVLGSCEEALAGIIRHRPPSLWFAWVLRGFVPVVRDRWEQGRPGGPGAGRGGGGDTIEGRGVGARDPRAYIYIYMYIYVYRYRHAYRL